MKAANKETHIAAIAAGDSARAALEANKTTRALISAFLIIPDDPASKVRIGLDGTVALDLHITDLGQSWARDVYINARITVKKGQTTLYDQTAFGGGLDVSPQKPWNGVIDDFPKFQATTRDVDEFNVSAQIALSYSNMFDETRSQTADLTAGSGVMNAPCCTIKQLDGFMELQRPIDLGRLPPIGNNRPR